MLFTITDITNVILDLDTFNERPQVLLDKVLAAVSHLKTVAVTSLDDLQIDAKNLAVFTASGPTEALMFQNVLRRAMISVSAVPSNTIFIACSIEHLKNASELLLGTVIYAGKMDDFTLQKVFEQCPDAIIHKVSDLSALLEGKAAGFGGEYYSTPDHSRILKRADTPNVFYPLLPNSAHPDCPTIVAGRYFSEVDPRHAMHALSLRLIGGKKNPSAQAVILGGTTAIALIMHGFSNSDLLVAVPPRPNQEDRLGIYLQAISTISNPHLSAIGKSVNLEVLSCNRQYEKMKNLGARARVENIRGVFDVKNNIKGRTVAVLDDIMTTGATMNEVIKSLKDAGAAKVMPVVLGYHPFSRQILALDATEQAFCTACNSPLVPRLNSKTGEPFFGCSNWKPYQSHTQLNFGVGVAAKLTKLIGKLMMLDDELNSENWFF